MSSKIASLLIDLNANVAKLQTDFAKAQKTVDGALGKMGATMKAFGGAVAGYFAVDAIVGFVDSTVTAADEIGKMASQVGVSVETLSAMGYAAAAAGTDVNEVKDALGNLSEKIVEAAGGSQDLDAMFRSLGVSVKDAAGNLRSPDEVLGDLADAFAKMPDGTAKTAVAMKLFGEQGIRLIPMLNQGRAGLAAMKEEAAALGALITSDTAAAAAQFKSDLARVDMALQGIANNIVQVALPHLDALAQRMVTAAKESGGFKDAIDTGFKLVASVATIVGAAFELVGKRIAGVAATVASLLAGEWSEAARTWQMTNQDSVDVVKNALDSLKQTWTETGRAATAGATQTSTAADAIVPAFAAAKDEAKELEAAVREALEAGAGFKDLADGRKASLDASKDAARQGMDAILEARALQAQATKDQTDDIVAAYAVQAEALKRKLEDGLLDEELYGEQLRALHAAREIELTDVTTKAAEERARQQRATYQPLINDLGTLVSDGIVNPMLEGMSVMESFFKTMLAVLKKIVAELLSAAVLKMIMGAFGLGGLIGGGSGGLLGDLLGFADGGLVRGAGTGTSDSNLAKVSNGEYINTAKAVRFWGPGFMDAVNQMKVPAVAGMLGASLAAAPAPQASAPTFHFSQTVNVPSSVPNRRQMMEEIRIAMREGNAEFIRDLKRNRAI